MVGWEGTLASPWVRGVSGQEQDEGDASVPSPLNPTPAPTDTPRPFSKNLPVKGPGRAPPLKFAPLGLVPALVNARHCIAYAQHAIV